MTASISWPQSVPNFFRNRISLPFVHVVKFQFISCVLLLVLSCLVCKCCCLVVCIVVVILCVFVLRVHCCGFFFCALDAGMLARSHYSEGPAAGHLETSFSWFSCAYKQMLRWFPRFQVTTTCFSCSPPNLNLVVTNFMFCLHVK